MRTMPPDRNKGRSPLARLHSPAVMLLLVFLLVVYLVYVLAENYGIEGEGGWLGEVLGAGIFVAGVIFAAILVGAALLGLRTFFQKRRGDGPWSDNNDS